MGRGKLVSGEIAFQLKRGQGHGFAFLGVDGYDRENEKADIPMIASLGKMLVVVGLVLAGLGVILVAAGHSEALRALWARFPLGRLPGDIRLGGDNFSFYFPWVTCLAVSLVVSLLLWVLRK
jgi:hypothetical protein